MCPMEAFTTNLESRYFWIVLTFVGDSTTTNDFPTRVSLCVFTSTARHAVQPLPEPAADVPAHPCGRDTAWAPPGGDGPLLAPAAAPRRPGRVRSVRGRAASRAASS